jgi:cytochrome c553
VSVCKAWVVVAALALAGGAASAADIEAGKRKAALCEACHGPEGNSVLPAIPSIAGQPAQFISNALFFFREGNRKDPQMTPIASTLSNADMNDVAAYFSSLKMAPPKHRASAENAAAGPGLAQKFMCTQCHGPALLGQQHIPRIAGQLPDYLRTQLKGFKASTRSDIDGNMTSAAQALSEKDIEVLVDYIAGIGAP